MITINYQVIEEYCPRCKHSAKDPKPSGVRTFSFTEENILSAREWKRYKDSPEVFDEKVKEYVYDTIDFYAVDSNALILLEPEELDKISLFIKVSLFNHKAEVLVNQSSYDRILQSVDFIPANLKITALVPEDEAYVVDVENLEKLLSQSLGVPNTYLEKGDNDA